MFYSGNTNPILAYAPLPLFGIFLVGKEAK